VMGRGGGQAAGDRAAADDCKTFFHLHLPLLWSLTILLMDCWGRL
jgi:hypothetical protein